MLSLLQAQPQSVAKDTPPSEISSTTDALAQMRLKHKTSSSGEPNVQKGATLKELEASAAPFEEVVEEVVAEKRGAAGMAFVLLFLFLLLLSMLILFLFHNIPIFFSYQFVYNL